MKHEAYYKLGASLATRLLVPTALTSGISALVMPKIDENISASKAAIVGALAGLAGQGAAEAVGGGQLRQFLANLAVGTPVFAGSHSALRDKDKKAEAEDNFPVALAPTATRDFTDLPNEIQATTQDYQIPPATPFTAENLIHSSTPDRSALTVA